MCRGCEICYFDEPSKCGVSNDVGRRKRGKNYMRIEPADTVLPKYR